MNLSPKTNPPEHIVQAIRNCKHWIFDMDGTLTKAMHDFGAIREQLGLEASKPILESIEKLPAADAMRVSAQLNQLELEIAAQAIQQPGAERLLTRLNSNDRKLGILTRNGKDIARVTLNACGLNQYFRSQDVISRDCCAPKPAPDGILHLLASWNATTASTVMVGDYLFDLEAGHAAGTHTIHLAVDDRFLWPEKTTLGITSLTELIELL